MTWLALRGNVIFWTHIRKEDLWSYVGGQILWRQKHSGWKELYKPGNPESMERLQTGKGILYFFIFCWPYLSSQILVNNQPDALIHVFIYSFHLSTCFEHQVLIIRRSKCINTFAAGYLNTQGLNNSCLESPASTLVDLTFQSRALRSFSLNQLRNLSL